MDEHDRSFITIDGFLTDRPSRFIGVTRLVKDDIDVSLNEDGIFSTCDSNVLHQMDTDK